MPHSLKIVVDTEPVVPPSTFKRAPVEASTLAHKDLRRGEWWRKIPAYRAVDEATFLDHAWQAKSSITRVA
jgi:lysine 2,3-aminomutase